MVVGGSQQEDKSQCGDKLCSLMTYQHYAPPCTLYYCFFAVFMMVISVFLKLERQFSQLYNSLGKILLFTVEPFYTANEQQLLKIFEYFA